MGYYESVDIAVWAFPWLIWYNYFEALVGSTHQGQRRSIVRIDTMLQKYEASMSASEV